MTLTAERDALIAKASSYEREIASLTSSFEKSQTQVGDLQATVTRSVRSLQV